MNIQYIHIVKYFLIAHLELFEYFNSKIKFAQKSSPESRKAILKTETWFPWSEFLLIATGHPVEDVKKSVSIDYPMFFPKFKSILKTTPKRVQANYMMYKVVEQNLQSIYPFLEDFIVPSQESSIPEQFFCKGLTESIFQYAILSQYFKEYNSDIVEQRGLAEIIENIKNQYLKEIAKVMIFDNDILHNHNKIFFMRNILHQN